MKWPLHTRMLLGFVVGAVGGMLCYAFAGDAAWLDALVRYVTQPVGQIFLRLLLMLVIPLLFSALVLGVSEMGDLRALGRVGLKTLGYTIAISLVSVVLGLVAVNLFKPGAGIDPQARATLLEGASERASAITTHEAPTGAVDMLVHMVPDNVVRAAADGDILAVMLFALLFGIAMALVPGESTTRLREMLDGLFEVTMKLIGMIISVAPYAVACLLFTLTAKLGWDVLLALGRYVAVVLGVMLVHQFGVYSMAVRFIGGKRPLAFFRAIEEAMLTAFSTASSNATLPTSLKVAEENLRLPPKVSRFVLTVGATANQNGTALFEGITVIFLAQFFGIDLDLGQQAVVLGVAVLGGIGTAGVPAGSLPVVAMILAMVSVPVEGIGLILGVDRFLDMCRTTLNVSGDLVVATMVSRGEEGGAPEDGTVA